MPRSNSDDATSDATLGNTERDTPDITNDNGTTPDTTLDLSQKAKRADTSTANEAGIFENHAATAGMDVIPDQSTMSAEKEDVTENGGQELEQTVQFGPPSRPPPVPPRPPRRQSRQGLTFGEIENIAQQRDVTEVIGNVLFQLECAIRPASALPDGEQWDMIKEYV